MTPGSSLSRPAGMREATLLMCLFNVAGAIVWQPRGVSPGTFRLTCGIAAAIAFVLLWQFWQGRNWARWLVLVASVLSLVNMTALGSATLPERILIIAEAALGLWLLFWLNTSRVRSFFRGTSEPSAA